MATRTIRFLGAACIIGLLLVLVMTPALWAQRSTTQPEPAALESLLQEVQLLRNAIERAVLVNSRMQLSLLRLNVEQQRIADLSDVLRDTQTQLAAIAATRRSLTRQLDSFTAQRRRSDAEGKRDADSNIRHLERPLEEQHPRELQLRTQENDTMVALQAAEARLNDRNSRLDQIEQLLSEPPRRY